MKRTTKDAVVTVLAFVIPPAIVWITYWLGGGEFQRGELLAYTAGIASFASGIFGSMSLR